MNSLRDAIREGANEMWPGIAWTTELRDRVFWIQGSATNGHEAMRGVPLSVLDEGRLTDALSTACQAIADEISPSFIDWTLVA